MPRKQDTALLKSMEALITHCENVPELRAHVYRLKSYVRKRQHGQLSAGQVRVMDRRQQDKRDRGITI